MIHNLKLNCNIKMGLSPAGEGKNSTYSNSEPPLDIKGVIKNGKREQI
jgi:hypothetical protein